MALDLYREVVLRWSDPDPRHIPVLKQGGVTALVLPSRHDGFAKACRDSGLQTALEEELTFVSWSEIGGAPADAPAVLIEGLWPGVSRGPNVPGRGDETASASREPWIDANGYWLGCLRALYPRRPAVLGYQPDKQAGLSPERVVPYDSHELALIEAWASGGNYILTLERRFKEALLKGEEKALAAWRQLGRTAAWLREHAALFRQPALPAITALVDPATESAELVNLMYRRHASPALAPASAPPAPDPQRLLCLVAASIRPPNPDLRAKILAHANAGAIVVADAPGEQAWWRDARLKPTKKQEDRVFYALGKGQVVAYKQPIADPSEFALDVIDLVTHKRRAVRMWNALSVIATATTAESGRVSGAAIEAINYGEAVDHEVQARIQGGYTKATLLRPEGAPVALQVAKRGTTTEVQVPELRRLGLVVFS